MSRTRAFHVLLLVALGVHPLAGCDGGGLVLSGPDAIGSGALEQVLARLRLDGNEDACGHYCFGVALTCLGHGIPVDAKACASQCRSLGAGHPGALVGELACDIEALDAARAMPLDAGLECQVAIGIRQCL